MPVLSLILEPKSRRAVWLSAFALVLLAGCATPQPVVYLKPSAGPVVQKRVAGDVQECQRIAQGAVGVNGRQSSGLARSAGRTGAIGWASTAIAGVVSSSQDVWKRAKAGAAAGATGAAVKTLLEWNDPDEVNREYVQRCMSERGHDVLGWR